MMPRLLTVVIPAYNEEKRIGKTIERIMSYLEKKKISYELIIVDDGSTDSTIRALKDLKIINLKVLKNLSNLGKGYSVRKGVLSCKGDYALFSDADLSTPIDELEKFFKFIPEYDIIIGSRKMQESRLIQKQPFWRVFAGNVFPIIAKIMLIIQKRIVTL